MVREFHVSTIYTIVSIDILSDSSSIGRFYFLVRDSSRKFLHNYVLTIAHVNRTFHQSSSQTSFK